MFFLWFTHLYTGTCGCCGFKFMLFNATFYSISVILWWSVLLMEETTDLSQVTDKLYHIMLHRIHLAMSRIQTQNWRRLLCVIMTRYVLTYLSHQPDKVEIYIKQDACLVKNIDKMLYKNYFLSSASIYLKKAYVAICSAVKWDFDLSPFQTYCPFMKKQSGKGCRNSSG